MRTWNYIKMAVGTGVMFKANKNKLYVDNYWECCW